MAKTTMVLTYGKNDHGVDLNQAIVCNQQVIKDGTL
jgi:hypothetical protein